MFTRTTGFFIVPLWLAAMGWVVAHDVWPAWTAPDPPRVLGTDWLKGEGNKAQFSILYDNAPIGTIWTKYLVGEDSVQRSDLIWIERLPIDVAPLRFIIESVFTSDGLLDEFTVQLRNRDGEARLHGERFHSDFSFTLDSGPVQEAFKMPLVDGGVVTGAFNPFNQLTDLSVGQTWRVQVFNPVAALTNSVAYRFYSMLVKVTGEETIITADGERNCLVVEAPNAKAWVDRRGVVYVQEMTLPITGKIRIVRESGFDEDAHAEARQKMPVEIRRAKRP